MPSGPTVIDEMANTAFWLGAMVGIKENYGDIRSRIEFVDVRDNFSKAARYGIDSTFNWFDDQKKNVPDLLKETLIPLAREGLRSKNIDPEDIERYMDVNSERAEKHMTGARWILRSYTQMRSGIEKEIAQTMLTSSMVHHQNTNLPVHTWPIPQIKDFKTNSMIAYTVSEAMITDVFAVRQEDIIEMVAEMMIWKRIRQVPVEDKKGKIVGMVSYRQIIEAFIRQKYDGAEVVTVEDIMETDPPIINEETPINEAIQIMSESRSGALIIANEKKELLGLISDLEVLRMVNRYLNSKEYSENLRNQEKDK